MSIRHYSLRCPPETEGPEHKAGRRKLHIQGHPGRGKTGEERQLERPSSWTCESLFLSGPGADSGEDPATISLPHGHSAGWQRPEPEPEGRAQPDWSHSTFRGAPTRRGAARGHGGAGPDSVGLGATTQPPKIRGLPLLVPLNTKRHLASVRDRVEWRVSHASLFSVQSPQPPISTHSRASFQEAGSRGAMNQNQLGPEPQTALTPKPSSGGQASGGEQLHCSVASPASGSTASPSPAAGSGIAQSVASPGTYIQIPVNAEVRCVSTFSLPMAVQQKIFGGTRNLPKAGEGNKPTTAIYICPVNPVKVTEAKRLLPLAPKPAPLIRGARGVADPVQETPATSPAAKVQSKESSSWRQDTKMNGSGKEATVTPTPVSVKFCNNLASQVLKTFVKQQAKGASMDSLMQAYSSSPLDTKAGSSFRENALLLFNGQLYFLAQKGIEIPTGADKGRLLLKEPGPLEPKVLLGEPRLAEQRLSLGEPGPVEQRLSLGEPGPVEQRIETSQTSLSTSTTIQDADSPAIRHELDTKGKECDVKRANWLNDPSGMGMGAQDTSLHPVENGLDLAQQVVKQLPQSLPGSCARRLPFSEDRDLLLKAGIVADVRVCLHRICTIGVADTSGSRSGSPIRYIPELLKEPDPVDLKGCPELSREPGPAELEECPELIREHDPAELEECPELFKEAGPADLEECPDHSRVPGPVAFQECPELSKEPGPVVMEECSASFSPALLEVCPAISREPSPVALEECPDYSKKHVPIATEDGVDPYTAPSPAELEEYSEPPVNSSSVDLVDCLSESEDGFHSKYRRKRKEVEEETQTSGCLNLDLTDQSVNAKRRKHHEEDTCSETFADSQMESCRDLDVESPETVENPAPILSRCPEVSSSLELSSLTAKEEKSASPSCCKPHPPEQESPAGLSPSNPLEVDETVREEKINRLKQILKEKQEALDQVRKKIALSSPASYSATLESFTL
ncbi:uncharacterized protein [Heptranchias perlo]|uniref:uncharacterized protein n=1 Tax=Heptranchias perlo TaxID=212740 RepID=UPI0035599D64